MFTDYLKISFLNIKNRKMRSWLTIIGIIIGVATIIALLSLSDGLKNAISQQFQSLGVNNIQVFPANLRGPPTGSFGLDKSDVRVVESVRGVDYVNPVLFDITEAEFNNEKTQLFIMAEEPSASTRGFADLNVELIEGRFLTESDSSSILVGYNVAYDVFEKDIRLRNSIIIRERKFKVVGIFEKTGTDVDNRVFIVQDVARELFNKPDIVNFMTVVVLPGEELAEVAERIEDRLELARGKEDFEVFTPEQIMRQLGQIIGLVQAVLVAIAAISLAVGSVGIMNSMFTSVLERTKEIGIFKAVGAKNSDIFLIFVIESGMVGLLGGAIGTALGLGIAKGTEVGAKLGGFALLSIRLDYNLIIFGLAFAFIIGIISGFVPALRASKLKPVDALRFE